MEIHIEEKKDLSELLSQSMANHAEFTKTKKERAMDLPEGFYSNEKNSTFFTSELATMANILTDEVKRDKVLQRISEVQSLERLDALRHNNRCWLKPTRLVKAQTKILFGEIINNTNNGVRSGGKSFAPLTSL
jgi:hypothetical protein